MIICKGYNNQVYWLHDDDKLKELEEYINDDNVIVVDKVLSIPEMPEDDKIRVMKYNEDTQELYAEVVGTKPKSAEQMVQATYEVVETSSFDNLINMDMLLGLDDKLNKILEHLGLEV